MRNSSKGFTLLEVMIAIAIFGLLMGMVFQLLHSEIRVYTQASTQYEIEQKARTAMMHVLDEVKLNRYTYFDAEENYINAGIYSGEPGQPIVCLVNMNPSEEAISGNLEALPHGTRIYYDYLNHELLYRDPQQPDKVFLIADQITAFSLSPVDRHLLTIYLEASDPSGNITYNLLTWVRMY